MPDKDSIKQIGDVNIDGLKQIDRWYDDPAVITKKEHHRIGNIE